MILAWASPFNKGDEIKKRPILNKVNEGDEKKAKKT